MRYYKNLYQSIRTSKWATTIGILSIIFGIASFFVYDHTALYIILSITYILSGISIILQSAFGYNIDSFFGKAYIEIDDDFIRYKEMYRKEHKVQWKDIRSLDYNSKSVTLTIKTNDDSIHKLSLSVVDFITINEIKSFINDMAEKRQITFSQS